MVEWGKAAAATIVATAIAAAMPCAAREAIAIGEDILRNGALAPGEDGYPPEWDLSYECRIGRNAFFEPAGGAGAEGPASHAVRFAAQGWKPLTLTLRQFDIPLSTAGVYRLSGRIRTRGLRCRSSGLVVADSGWKNDYGVSPLPEDTGGEWREVAAEVRLSPSADGLYSVAFYAQGLAAGELEMSDCRLEALDAEAAAGAGRSGVARDNLAVSGEAQDMGDVSGKCLNNLVCELVSRECRDGETVAFDVSRDGWLHIALDGGEDASASLDGAVAIASGARRREAFRRVAAGRHEIAVLREGPAPSGPRAAVASCLTVCEIPEILNYCPFTSPAVAENPPREWEWLERNVFPATTTQIGGDIPAGRLCDFKAMGGVWLGNLVTRGLADDGDLARRLAAAPALAADDPHDGLTCDEQAFDRFSHLRRYTAGLKRFCAEYRCGKSIYTWLIGRAAPMHRGADEEFIGAAANAPGGRILVETYCTTQPSEADAREYMDDFIVRIHRLCRERHPLFARSCGMVLGAFTQTPALTQRHHPEVDYKRYLDMQLNLLANHAEFKGLRCVGVWGTQYADDEMARWAFRLLRHYCVEGRRDLLSDSLGFAYAPGILANGDFDDGLGGWETDGAVSVDRVEGFAQASEGRWKDDYGQGDAFAVLKRGRSGKAGILRRKITGLVPGRPYCLEACVFDAADARAHRAEPKEIPLAVEVRGAEARPELSWTHVAKQGGRTLGAAGASATPVNLRHIVFTATAPDAEVVFDASTCPADSETGVNFVSILPYYE